MRGFVVFIFFLIGAFAGFFISSVSFGQSSGNAFMSALIGGVLVAFIVSRLDNDQSPLPAKPAAPRTYPPMPVWPYNPLNSHGSANWDNPTWIDPLFNQNVTEPECGYFLGYTYRLSMLVHGVTIAGSGQGKGVCLILPNLLSKPNCSWFVMDPKGEIALITAGWQQQCGQRVVLLDPWQEQKRLNATHGIEPVGFNPLGFVRGNMDELPESCAVIAEMLVPDNPHAKDSYWESRARSLIKTYLLHMITARPESEQHLGTLYQWLRLPVRDRQRLWFEMEENEECDGLVKFGIGEFIGLSNDTGPLPSIMSTAQDNTSFLESTPLRAALANDEFDPYSLTDGKTTVYLCLPERFLDSHARWLRLVVGVCLKACNFRPDKRVNFIFDEFAILDKMKNVQRAFAFARGQNISIWVFVQSLTQLIEIYGEHGANAFLANARLRQFFGVYDLHTQKYLSEYLGDTTVLSYSTSHNKTSGGSSGTSSGSSSGWSSGGSSSGSNSGSSSGVSWSTSKTTSEQPMARRLLTVEEIGKEERIITLIDRYKFPIPRLPYWDSIHQAHIDGRAQYVPIDRQDWEAFHDELDQVKPARGNLKEVFLGRSMTTINSA